MCNSQRQSTVFENSSENFIWIGFPFNKDSNMNVITTSYCSNISLSFFSSFKTVYTELKSVQEPSIMEKYPILQICRTAGFKIDIFPSRKITASCLGKCDFCIITTYFIWETSQFFTLSFHSSLWSWRMIFESGHQGRALFPGQAGLLTSLYLERLSC